jgi:hypothetical protein
VLFEKRQKPRIIATNELEKKVKNGLAKALAGGNIAPNVLE